jgi:site-specific recombinase XerD
MLPESDIMNGITAMKEPATLPDVLSKCEVFSLLAVPLNIKHKAILEVLYSTGIRLQERCDLELCDIKRADRLVHVKSGKGKKERYTIISQQAIDTLTIYYCACRPKRYLFEGRNGNQYSKRSIEKIVTCAALKAVIKRKVSPHTLRHSFATHLHENGVSLQIIQKLLGHSDIHTTTIYSHVSTQSISAVANPLDLIIAAGKEQK